MQRLIEGVRQFHNQEYLPNQDHYKHLAQGQKPEALFITCCDSRIQPHAMTGTGAGDLFLLRNIGNIIPPDEEDRVEVETAVEYALIALGVKDIIICGHTHCGAMHALLHPDHLDELPAVRRWLEHGAESLERTQARRPGLLHDAMLRALIEENVVVQLERLREIPSVRDRLADGRVRVHGWVYEIEDGDVVSFDPDSGRFTPLDLSEASRE